MAENYGLKQADHDLLKRALSTHEHVTGERVTHLADSIPVLADEDPKAKAAKAQKDYEAQAKLNSRVEETAQAERRARAAATAPSDAQQPGNPGGGQEALATDRAKAAGEGREGEKPASGAPSH